VPSVSIDYFIARSTSHKTYGGLESGTYFFTAHLLGFATRTPAAAHQLHHPGSNYIVGFNCQQHLKFGQPQPSQ